ncbi:MAG: hypothetical protein NWQ48_10405 [Alishewanella sp.]|nr:hypothetical protein [Alishewanella sp.]MDP5186652.1 hypothetical protein [Alishewanella sp.]
MKSVLLSLLLSLPTTSTVPTELQQLFEQARYPQLMQQLQQVEPNAALQLLKAKALIQQQQREEANTLLNELVIAYPNDVAILTQAALNKVALANDGSLFQARKRATDALALFQQAVELDAHFYPAQQALITFYQTAPANVGGSKSLAAEQANRLQQLNAVQGVLAKVMIAVNESRLNEALAMLEQQLQLSINQPDLLLRKATLLAQQNAYLAAQEAYLKALPFLTDPIQQYSSRFQIGRLAVFTNQYQQQGIEALESYLAYYQGSQQSRISRAKLRLAQLYLQQGNKDKARSLYLQIAEVLTEEQDFLDARSKLGSLLQQ